MKKLGSISHRGEVIPFYESSRKDKQAMVKDPASDKWVHFGDPEMKA